VRVLLDENLPHDLARALTGHQVHTVQGAGWAGVKNGDLLRRMNGQFDALLTMDRNLEREHNLTILSFGVIVIRAHSNRVPDVLPLVSQIREALNRIRAGHVEHVGG
jgi:hypothetical protein